uniref:NADH-ubiquinone oxidoreductase chain 1 n=1 Tax=Microcosmus sulcatus TaxID=341086 RepID=D2YVG9_9ASCI|nr:NADH dehydrogenase subunit 1 [Microcosmus sulcatus]CAL23092.2 NADH dehydrogenase subunit 1 [Microcosmus sulcatus]
MFLFADVCLVLYLLMVLLLVAFLVLLERKVLGVLQIRKGPNIVGVNGLMQTVMDGVKLLMKKYFMGVFNVFFLVAPLLGFVLSLMQWGVMSIPGSYVWSEYTVVITFVLSGLGVFIIMWCGWGSSNSYGFIGSIRGVAQMISYEVVFFFFVMIFMIGIGVYSWGEMLDKKVMGVMVMNVMLFFMWLVLILSELNRAPFDLVEGESELVSGFNVEYSGVGFTLLFLAEYMNIWFLCLISSVVFLNTVVHVVLGGVFLTLVVVLVRGLLPRYKFNQLIDLMWKVFLPITMLLLVISV